MGPYGLRGLGPSNCECSLGFKFCLWHENAMIKTMRPDAAKERAEGDVIELPGGDKSVLTVGAKNNTIRVAGTKTIDYAEDVSLHRRECISGMFDRTLVIPMQINPEGIKAEYHGVLALFVPRVEHDKARRIEVRSKARS